MNEILITALAIGGLGLICGAGLALAARFFTVKKDPRIQPVMEILPGINCGGCGYAGCADYAKAIVLNNAAINLCAPGAAEVIHKLAVFMGVKAPAMERKVAIVLCGGDITNAPRKFMYNGIADCSAASAVNDGDKICRYGCLGYGSCVRVCPNDAIEIKNNLAVVHPDLCIGCGACVKVCPRNLIKLIPENRKIHVLCSSKDKGPVVKKACKVGCIGCTLCAKPTENKGIKMEGALAVVDYSQTLENTAIISKCLGHCIIKNG